MNSVKELVRELEAVLGKHSSQLDVSVHAEFQERIEVLKRQVDQAGAQDYGRIGVMALSVLASLLEVVTNVMNLLK